MRAARRTPDLSTIAGRLKAERARLGYTQAGFAAIGGRKMRGYQEWEHGKSFPTADVLAAFAQVGADVQYIITGTRISTTINSVAVGIVREALAALPKADRSSLFIAHLQGELDR